MYRLLTYDCSAEHPSHHNVKFEDNMAVVGLNTHSNEFKYSLEVKKLFEIYYWKKFDAK